MMVAVAAVAARIFLTFMVRLQKNNKSTKRIKVPKDRFNRIDVL